MLSGNVFGNKCIAILYSLLNVKLEPGMPGFYLSCANVQPLDE